jgi:selenide,water dikinase
MLAASGVAAELDAAAVPLLPGVLDLARSDVVAGGTKRNHAYVAPVTDFGALTAPERLVLADAQTSGGLLIAASDGDRLADALAARGVTPVRVGRTVAGEPGRIDVLGRLSGEPARS